jgi:glutamate-1-semialdehyde aminotransferase
MVCSGTEAIELALRLARTFTKGTGIICSNATYHGNSHETFRMTVGPFEPEFRRVSFPDSYRPLEQGLSDEALCDLYLQEIEHAIAGFAADGVPFAGMLFCSIFANEGLPNVPAGYMQKAAKLVRDAGGVVIFDEVQAGFVEQVHGGVTRLWIVHQILPPWESLWVQATQPAELQHGRTFWTPSFAAAATSTPWPQHRCKPLLPTRC